MKRHALALAALAVLATACDDLVQRSAAQVGGGELQSSAPERAEGGDPTALKFKARPPAGLNAPPRAAL